MVIVNVDLATAEEYKNKTVSAVVDNKKVPAYFRLVVDDFSILSAVDLAKSDSKIILVEYIGTPAGLGGLDTKGVYVGVPYDFGMDVTENDIKTVLSELPTGVTMIIKLPEEYCDMEFIYNMSIKYNRVRFCGGDLLNIPKCNIGCCGDDIVERKGVKLKAVTLRKTGCGCALQVLDSKDVELVTGVETKSKTASKKVVSSLYAIGREDF